MRFDTFFSKVGARPRLPFLKPFTIPDLFTPDEHAAKSELKDDSKSRLRGKQINKENGRKPISPRQCPKLIWNIEMSRRIVVARLHKC